MPNKSTERPWERQKGESAQAFEAFIVYLQMGTDRSLSAVGQKLGKSRALMERWSSSNGWVERCRAWDNYLQREARKAAVAEVRSMTKRHIILAQALQGAAAKALKDRGTVIITDKNLAAVVKLATDLERSSRMYEVETLSEDLKKAEEDSTAVKIICDIPRVQPLADVSQAKGDNDYGTDG